MQAAPLLRSDVPAPLTSTNTGDVAANHYDAVALPLTTVVSLMTAIDAVLSINNNTSKLYWYILLNWDKCNQGNIVWYFLNLHDEGVTFVMVGCRKQN